MQAFLNVMCSLFPPGLASLVRVLCYCFVTFTITGIIATIVSVFSHLKGLFRFG